MKTHPPHRSRHKQGGPPPRLLALLILLTALLTAPSRAQAEGCDNCPEPSLAELAKEAGFALKERADAFGVKVRDTYHIDAGECTATSTGKPEITQLRAWLVLRGMGEVWHCPHSKSTDAVTVTTSATDSTAWSLKTKIGAKLKGPGAELMAEVEAGITTGVTITEVTTVTKTITPAYCHRIAWEGWFEVGEFQATGTFSFQQRFAWWTKNALTGAKVHAKGDYTQQCGTADIALGRHAPIAGYFDLAQSGCKDAACSDVQTQRLGFFPELPPYLDDPKPDTGGTDEESSNDPGDGTSDDDNPDDDNPDDDNPDDDTPDSDDARDQPSSGELGPPPTGPLPDPLAGEGE